MKKRILSIALAVCLVLSCVPITVFAANTDTTELQGKFDNGGTVKLTRDYTVDSSLIVTKDVTVDLNGYVIRKTGIGRLFNIALETGTPANARLSLTLKDSNSTRKHTGENASLPDGGVLTGDPSTESGAVHIGFKGRFIMEGGTIYGFHAQWGAAVYAIWGGHFFLKNGTISNCSADFGGAVYLRYDKNTNTVDDKTNKMTMSGGAIRDCVATYAAGGVYCSGENTFTMEGGIIENCKSLNKTLSRIGVEGVEGVYIGATYILDSTFIVNGGIIKDVVFISTFTQVENTNSGSVTKFYDNVVNIGTISGGVYYSGIQNETGSVSIDKVSYTSTGTVTGTCYKVNFKLNGADGSIPNQWFVNTNKETALNIKPTREGYEFRGWYNGNTYYNFTKPVTGNITLTAKWALNNVSTEAELRQAINDGASKIKLIGDIKLTSPLLLNDKVVQLDLNGHVLKGDLTQGAYILLSATNSTMSYGAMLTLNDSNPTATHTGSSLPLGGVLDCSIGLNADDSNTFGCALRADGGTVTGIVGLNHDRAYIHHTSGNTTPTAFMKNVSGSYGGIYSGIYYDYLAEHLIKGNTVTFKNGDDIYAKEIVSNEYVNGSSKPGVAVAPIEPVKDGFVFAGWYNGSTKYDFSKSVTSNITLTAKWLNEVTDETTLRAAINEGITTIKLMADIKLSSVLDLTDKNITLDLNGYVLTGNIQLADNSAEPKSILTLIDSRPTATHSDKSLPVGGVVKGNITLSRGNGSVSHLYANGGTVTGQTSLSSYAGGIFCTSDTPTAFKAYVGNYGEIHGGIFYGSINESIIKEKTVTFMNGSSRYALEVVADGNKVVAPISPVKEGYNSFDGWYNGNTKYTFGSSLSEDITLTAKYSNPKAYNISYNLNGGTATNPGTYTVESDAITLNNPVKTGYTFTGWSGTGLTGVNNMTVTIAKGSTGDRTYTAHFSQNNYTVKFDTVGGSSISDKTGVKWTDTVLSGITAPTKDGYEFTGWKCGDKTVNANTKYSDLVANDTVKSVTLVAQWKDAQKPVITGLKNNTTYCDAVEFEVTDNNGVASVKTGNTILTPGTNGKYTLAKGIGTVTVVATDNTDNTTKVTVTVNNGHTAGTDDGNCSTPVYCIYHPTTVVVAAKSHNFFGNWNNDENGHWHTCQNAGCNVAEPKASHSGTDDGDCTTAVICDCGYIITAAKSQHSYGAWQSNGNNKHTRNCSVTGCNGYEKKGCTGGTATCTTKAICDYCNTKYGELKSSNHTGSRVWEQNTTQHKQYWNCCNAVVVNYQDHTWSNGVCLTCDYTCTHKDDNKDHTCDYGCDVPIGTCVDINLDHKCDYGCGKDFGIHADTDSDHNCDYCGEEMTTCLDDDKDHLCDICGATLSQHSGGTATCTSKAICEYCHQEYGELNSSNHNFEKISAKAATVTETGNEEYWHCLDCGKYFADENGTNEIKLDDTVILKLPPEIIEGEGQSLTQGEIKELSFRSNASFSDFIRVELDGVTVDAENYTATQGSTIITLKADYIATLSAGVHTIGIVSESGTAETTFTVNAKATDNTQQTEDDTTKPAQTDDTTKPAQTDNNDVKSPETGNEYIMVLLLAILLSCGGVIIISVAYGKKKKHSR